MILLPFVDEIKSEYSESFFQPLTGDGGDDDDIIYIGVCVMLESSCWKHENPMV